MRLKPRAQIPSKYLTWLGKHNDIGKSIVNCIRSCESLGEAKALHALASQLGLSSSVFVSNLIIDMYGRCGSVSDARDAFDSIPLKNSFSLNSILRACLINGCLEQARRAFDASVVDAVAGTTMVSAFAARGMVDQAKDAFERISDPDEISWNAMISCFAQNGLLDQAKWYFDEMPRRNVASFNGMLAANARNGDLSSAIHVYDKMPSWDIVSKNSMVALCGQLGNADAARQVFDSMDERNLATWNAMIVAYAANGQIVAAREAFHATPHRTVATWTSLLHGCGILGQVKQAIDVFLRMPSVDCAAWTAMAAAYAYAGDVDNALTCFYRIPTRDAVCCNAVSAAFARAGCGVESKKIFDAMGQRSIVSWNIALASAIAPAESVFERMPQRNLISWNAMLARFAQDSRAMDAAKAMERMSVEGIVPNSVSFLCLFSAFGHSGGIEQGRGVFRSMIDDHGVAPGRDHYACMIDLLGRCGHLDEAEELVASMPFEPNSAARHALLGSCRSHSDVERADRAAAPAIELGVASAYELLANAVCGSAV